jgi:hypothetical protein
MADSKTTTITIADIQALADRLVVAGTTTRRVDWQELQDDLQLSAKCLRALARSFHNGDSVAINGV